ncbi:MAG: hypothetical protein NUW07_10200 [Candidatus Saccharicenans sp.]|jgi:glucose-6-phosphate isomerase|nr:hypothetical protein [Candidatus Saccharicenans sp.]MDH7492486.1 hypothetical protein [Candidatus Saccharicenans sp.]
MKLEIFHLEPWQSEIQAALDKLRQQNFSERLLKKDYSLWKEKDEEISNRLGWLDSPLRMEPLLSEYRRQAEKIRSVRVNLLVLLGLGGSSLAPEAISQIIGPSPGYPKLLKLDSTSPAAVSQVAGQTQEKGTRPLFLVSSKSGTTAETLSFLNYFYQQQQNRFGREAGNNFIAITDPGTPLARLAAELRFSLTVSGFPDVGGRFSALSPFGLFPATLMGLEIKKFLQPAVDSYQLLVRGEALHPGLQLGAILGAMAGVGRDKLTVFLPAHLRTLGRWLEQLLAESTGKEGRGILPLIESLPLSAENYSQDRLFVFYQPESNPGIFWQKKLDSLKKLQLPLILVSFKPEDLAAHFYLWELATATAGFILGLNPFDQPDVELTKKKTREFLKTLASREAEATRSKIEEEELTPEIRAFLAGDSRRPDYLALLCFLPPGNNLDVALDNLVRQLSEKYHLPCTWNYGPAYLHSTGQLFKGDAGRGKFIGLVDDEPFDLPIPSIPASPATAPSFRQLYLAQARADFAALREKGREILVIHLKGNPVETIFRLGEIIRNI